MFRVDDFERWLREQPDDAIVGRAGDAYRCPVAQWARSQGFRDVSVTDPCIEWRDEKGYWRTHRSEWVPYFIAAFDDCGVIEATAAEALAVLHTVIHGEPAL